jgi:phosphohistidine phosphatase
MKMDSAILAFKNLIIWRHAEAHPALALGIEQDLARILTPKGKQQARRMANWLNKRLPKDVLVVSSPAMRAFQTAQALKSEVKVLEALKPNANLQQVLAAIANLAANRQSNTESLLIVGHQPWLWQLVAQLTAFTAQDISIKKGAVWWLRLNSDDAGKVRYSIVAVQSPSLLA